MGLLDFFTQDIGIDLGTANTLIYVKGKGIVLREPSVVAREKSSGKVLAVGEEAKQMIGRTPGNIVAIRPLKDGVIADFDVTEKMLGFLIKKVLSRSASWFKPRVVIGIPSGITEVEKNAVLEAAKRAGAKQQFLIEEPMAAAIGAGLPVSEPYGSMIVDIGGGTTEVAVISLGGIVASQSIRIAGDELDEAVVQYIKKAYNLLIGERSAEQIKIELGSAYPREEERSMEIRGRDLVRGLPKTVRVTDKEIREAMAEPINAIVEAVKTTLEKTPPELAADIINRGICLAGGGALLKDLDKLITQATGIPAYIAEDPLSCVVLGCKKVLRELDTLQKVLLSSRKK